MASDSGLTTTLFALLIVCFMLLVKGSDHCNLLNRVNDAEKTSILGVVSGNPLTTFIPWPAVRRFQRRMSSQ